MRNLLIIVLVAVLGSLGYVFFWSKNEDAATPQKEIIERQDQLESVDFSKINSTFRFSGQIPSEFEVEYIPQLKALSIYDPSLPGDSIRQKSQIYITSFEADRFLTLSTVEITQQDETLMKGHDAVLYEITKKPGVPDFRGQPSWRNFKHKAIDIRFTNNSPSLFYPFAYNPVLSESIFNDFIDSLVFHLDGVYL